MSRPLLVGVTEIGGRWRINLWRMADGDVGAAADTVVRFQRRTLREAVEAMRAWRRTGVVVGGGRATCARCQRVLAVTKAGLMRFHKRGGDHRACPGAGQPPAVNL